MASAADTAANFGYSMAFFQSDPELKSLLNSAVTGNWTPQQFVAKLQNTRWFKKNGEAARQLYALKTSDPATYNQRVSSARAQVGSLAGQYGAYMNSSQLSMLAEHALSFGWTDDQIKAALKPYVTASKEGLYRGGAGSAQMQLREMVSSYGYSPTAAQMGGWVKGMVSGATSLDQVRQLVMNQTASRYPGLKDRIMSGETLEDIAAPYKDSYSKILEVPGTTVNLRDPLIQKALQAKDKDGKPTTSSLWQFENDLKADPRWLKTQNAQDQLVGTTHKVLSDMGLVN